MKSVKLKYFMRGLGCGILLAVILLVFTTKGPSDAEIMKRAEKLGMVTATKKTEQDDKLAELNEGITTADTMSPDATVSPDVTANQDAAKTGDTKSADTKKEDTKAEETKTEDTKTEDTKIEETKAEDTKTADVVSEDTKSSDTETKNAVGSDEKSSDSASVKPTVTKDMTFQISKGMYSYAVASLLQEKGLVKNAKDFDRFLIQNGYQDEIQSGSYTIKAGSSYEAIAKAITK